MSAPRLKSASIAIFLAAFGLTGAYAQDASVPAEKPKHVEKFNEKFDAADTNHDGFLTRDEAAKGLPRIAKHFDAVDTDHDGKLSQQEVAQFLAAARKAKEQRAYP